jgi:copper chaperone
MKTLKFKTNINCGGCVAKVTPHFNEEKGIKQWNVDTANHQKILTVETDSLSENDVIQIVTEAGFKADKA